ncbi:MAG: PEP-CTERM sorting domain-containing protein [Desulfarculaceae bacterium]|nr:PEP-CTERM sorting domain-containing protein [Desulfarculaceae bacterium]MCF8072383.1 PEP-CTERM sorting domain-containing protein [Desulfarculaceae bacterium]MCF8100304.1 PEP-CTERM sorting domain-containing protein [Desulfarculaceae bacterium]MCF8116123.1 PEP-CTERM sorting domain-containing protein [Desulfarculaceae bacterium]
MRFFCKIALLALVLGLGSAGAARADSFSFNVADLADAITSSWSVISSSSKDARYSGPTSLSGSFGDLEWSLVAYLQGKESELVYVDARGRGSFDPNSDGLGFVANTGTGYGAMNTKTGYLELTFSQPVRLDSLDYTHLGSDERWAYSLDGVSWSTGVGDSFLSKTQGYGSAEVSLELTSIRITSGGTTGSGGLISFQGFSGATLPSGAAPEPGTLLLTASAGGLLWRLRRRARKAPRA